MSSSNKFLLGAIFGGMLGYIAALQRIVTHQQQIIELSQPPLGATRDDWWENNMPDTDDEYELTLAKRDWLRAFLLKFVYPYIDDNVASVLVMEVMMPLNRKLIQLEGQASRENRIFEYMMSAQQEPDTKQ